MKEFFNKYLNEENRLEKWQIIGVISLVIVIAGVFGFVYEFIFYYFNGGMKEFYCETKPSLLIFGVQFVLTLPLSFFSSSFFRYSNAINGRTCISRVTGLHNNKKDEVKRREIKTRRRW